MVYRALNLSLGLVLLLITQHAFAQATFVQARHETVSQTQIDVTFSQNISFTGAPLTTGWSVTLNGNPAVVTSVATNGPTVVRITIDATSTTGHVAGQPFILQTETANVRVSYDGSGNLTSVGGVTAFTNQLSANNFVFACSELIFFQQGVFPGASPDVCSPVVMNFFQFQYRLSLRFRNSTNYDLSRLRYAINWGDATATDAFPYQSDLLGAAAATFVDATGFTGSNPAVVLTARPSHTFPATTTPAPDICSWDIRLTPYFNLVATCFSLAQTNSFATYDTDNANSGTLNMPASVANTDRVCLGNNVDMQFTDNTLLNCRNVAGVETGVPNDLTRYIRIVYGSQDFDSPTLAGAVNNIPDVWVTLPATLGGATIPITNNDATGSRILPAGYYPTGGGGIGNPDFNGVIELPTPVNAATALTYMAQIFTLDPLTHQEVSHRFYVRLEYWDICNLYNSASPDANKVTISNYIEIIDKPAPPASNDKTFCSTQNMSTPAGPAVPGTCNTCFEVTAASVAGSAEIKWYTDPDDAVDDLNPIANDYGANSRFLRPQELGIPNGVNPVPGGARYKVWARYRTNVTAPNNCLSDTIGVIITERTLLSTPGTIQPLTSDVCDGTNGVLYSLTTATANTAFGGANEYFWDFSAVAGTTIADNTTTIANETISVNYNITPDPTPSATKTLRVLNRYTTGPTCPSSTSTRTITIYGPTIGGTASGGTDYCQGADADNITLTGNQGGVVRWEVNINSGGFADAGVGTVTTFDPGVLAPGNYIYRAVVANGPCSQQNSSTTTINVYATPTTATAGGNQDLCQPLATPSAGLGGNPPGVGTGLWTQISGPGTITFNPNNTTPNATATANAQGVYVVRWTISTGSGLCASSANVQLDFGAPPATPDAGPAQVVCTPSTSLNGTVPTFETGTWLVTGFPPLGTLTISDVNSPTATVTLSGGIVYGTYTLRWRFTSGTCTPTEDFVNITFNPPATSTPMTNFITCVDPLVLAPINLTGTVGGGATGGRWERVTGTGVIGSSGTGTGTNIIGATINDTFTPTAADLSSGTAQVRLVATGATAPCTEIGSTITITFDRRPTGVDAGATQPLVCADPVTGLGNTSLDATNLATGETGIWSGPGGVTFGNVNSDATTVSNLPGGVTTTLTWTVRSPNFGSPGSCAVVPDNVDITVNILPAAIDPAPNNLCEVVESSGVALDVDITQYNDGVTGIIGSANRTVEWYTNASRIPAVLVPDETSHDISNGLTLFTRVYNATTNCFRDGIVTFTVNPLPLAADQTFEFCEEFPSGSNQVQNINLNDASIINPITGAAANRTVVWFNTLADANGNINPILSAGTYDVLSGTENVFARVTNTITTCVNVAQVTLQVNPRPADPTIIGSENQCLNGFDLYSVTPVAGVTYIWDIDDNPATEFDVIAGGSLTDFLVVVSFPNVFSGNIRLTLDRDGCVSNQVVKPVTVQATPPLVAIITSKDPVCSNDGGIVYTATSLPLTDYTWEIPVAGGATGSSIIGGQGSNQVTVNIGSISGNIRVTPQTQGGSCAGSPATFFIDVRERPVLDDYPITQVCSDDAIGITLQEDAGSVIPASYNITNVTVAPGLNPSSRPLANGNASLIFNDSYTNVGNGNTPLDVRYTIVPVSAEGCEGSPKDIIARIRPEPIINPNLDRTVCSRDAANITLQGANNSAPADQFEITSIENNGGLVATAGNPMTGVFAANVLVDDVWENTTGVRDTIKYFIQPINSVTGCVGSPPYPILLIVYPEPQITSPTTDIICSGDQPTITFTATIPGSTFDWSVKPPIVGLISGGNSGTGSTITDVLINSDITPGSITYEVISTGPGGALGTCPSQPVDVTITVNPSPIANNIDQIVCSDAAGGNSFVEDLQALESTVNNTGTVTFAWYQDLGMTQQIVAPQLNAWPLVDGTPVYVDVFNGQCRILKPVTYTINPTPAVTASITSNYNGLSVSCAGSTNGQITADPATLGTPNYLYSIDGGTSFFTGRVFNGLSALGNPFVITVRDSKGCTSVSLPMTLTEPPALTATLAISSDHNGRDISCPGEDDGEITVTPLGGVAPYTFRILELPGNTTGNATGVYTGLRASTYTIFVTDANTVCTTTTNTVTVIDPPLIVATAVLDDAVRCNGESNGQISVTASGGTLTGPTYTFTLNQAPFTVNSTGVFSGLPAGTNSVTVSDNNSCSVTSNTVTVTQPAALTAFASVTSNYFGSKISCPGADDAQITTIVNGGNGGYGYVLDQDPLNVSGQTTGVFDLLGPNTYTITVMDARGCSIQSASVLITEPTPIAASVSITTTVSCVGETDGVVTVTATGGTGAYSFEQINPAGPTNASGIFTGLGQGSYDFEASDLNGCADVVTVPLTEPMVIASAVVTSNYAGAQVSCNGSSDGVITVSASGGAGAYTFDFDLNANASGQFTGIFSGVSAGTAYTFTATDSRGCSGTTAPINVVEPAAVNGSGFASSDFNGFDIRCFAETNGQITVTAGGGTGLLTYMLLEDAGNATGATSGIFDNLRAGSFRARISDVNGCAFTTTPIAVTQPNRIVVSITKMSPYNGYDVSCIGADDGEVRVTSTSGGAGGYTFTIDPPVNTSGLNTGIFTGLPADLYTITAADANTVCTGESLPVVLIDPLPLFEGIVGLDKFVCEGSDPTAFSELAPAFGGIDTYSYQWVESTDGTVFTNVPGATNPTFDPPPSTLTTFYKRLITSGSCTTMESNVVKVNVNPLPTATFAPSKTPVCEGDFFLLNFTFTGQAPFYFDFNDGTTFTNDRLGAANTPVPVLNYLNTTTYTVTEVRDFNGCVAASLPLPVTVPVVRINPDFTITSSDAQCSGSQFDFQFTVDPDVDYTWLWNDGQPNTIIAANSLANGTQNISHTFTNYNPDETTVLPVVLQAINSVYGCGPKQAFNNIQIFSNILVNVSADKDEICGGDDVRFTNVSAGGPIHEWFYREQGTTGVLEPRTDDEASSQTYIFNNTTTQNPLVYEVLYKIENDQGCSKDTLMEITVYREVAASFDKGVVPLFIGGNANMTFTNTSVPVDGADFSYDWDFGSTSSTPTSSGIGPFNLNYTSPGPKEAELIATNLLAQANGLTCRSVYSEAFDILLPALVANFTYAPINACFPTDITITENLATGDMFEWELYRDGRSSPLLISNDTVPTFRIVQPGRYTIYLTTTNSFTSQVAYASNSSSPPPGSTDVGQPIDIYDTPTAIFEIRDTIVFVPDELARVVNSSRSDYDVYYHWYFDDGTDTVKSVMNPSPDISTDNYAPMHQYQNEGVYDVALLAINDHGNGVTCIDTAYQKIYAKAQGFTRVPNAFTPSLSGPSDGSGGGNDFSKNDVFLPVMKGVKEFQMQIFDRWGNLIFESKDGTRGWDGYDKNGILLPAGVYVYKLVLLLANNQRTTQVGDVTMIR